MRLRSDVFAFMTFAVMACLLILPAWATETGEVIRVVDGDTIIVEIDGQEERVRLIGVDTPETVHPQKPVEYFGKEASAFTKRICEGKIVRLEADPQNSNRDKYGRLLRYVYLEDGTLLNAEIIRQGYGFAYTRFPFEKMEEFRELERGARAESNGLWAEKEEATNED